MTPCLETIFALRLSTGRKLLLIAMIHRARDGWYKGTAVSLAYDAQMNKSNTVHSFAALERMGLIYPGPDNRKHARPRSWRIDQKLLTIGHEHDLILDRRHENGIANAMGGE